LLEAKDRAEQSDHLKTAFLQNMSHEIRTPMNAIMGFSDLLAEQYNNKPKLIRFSKIINQRCADLLDIINEILDVAKIESGQLPVNIEECKLTLLFSEVSLFFEEYQKRQKKEHLEFNIQINCGTIGTVIMADKVKQANIHKPHWKCL
jgi:signal transduction histidine kinase